MKRKKTDETSGGYSNNFHCFSWIYQTQIIHYQHLNKCIKVHKTLFLGEIQIMASWRFITLHNKKLINVNEHFYHLEQFTNFVQDWHYELDMDFDSHFMNLRESSHISPEMLHLIEFLPCLIIDLKYALSIGILNEFYVCFEDTRTPKLSWCWSLNNYVDINTRNSQNNEAIIYEIIKNIRWYRLYYG